MKCEWKVAAQVREPVHVWKTGSGTDQPLNMTKMTLTKSLGHFGVQLDICYVDQGECGTRPDMLEAYIDHQVQA